MDTLDGSEISDGVFDGIGSGGHGPQYVGSVFLIGQGPLGSLGSVGGPGPGPGPIIGQLAGGGGGTGSVGGPGPGSDAGSIIGQLPGGGGGTGSVGGPGPIITIPLLLLLMFDNDEGGGGGGLSLRLLT